MVCLAESCDLSVLSSRFDLRHLGEDPPASFMRMLKRIKVGIFPCFVMKCYFANSRGITAMYVDNNMNTNDNKNPAKRISKRQNEGKPYRPTHQKVSSISIPPYAVRVSASVISI